MPCSARASIVTAGRPFAQVDRDSFAVWFSDTDGPKAGREALQTLVAQLARPLAARAGLHLSAWKPLHFVRDGEEVLLRMPVERVC